MKRLYASLLFITLGIIICNNANDDIITDNTSPLGIINYNLTWETSTAPQLPQGMVQDVQNRPFFYVAMKAGGVTVYNATNPVVVATISTTRFESLDAMNITQQGNYLYVALGNFFGGNSKAGLAVIDVSNPTTPLVTDFWTTATTVEGSAVVAVEGDYAYIGAMTQGVYVLNISDKNNITETSQFIPDVNFPTPKPNSIQAPNARDMAVNNNILYLCYDAGGLRIIDTTNKEKLIEIGRYINENINKQQAFNNVLLNGNIAYVATDYCGMEIIDVSNSNNPTRLAWLNPWGCETTNNTWFNSNGHMNQLAYDAASGLLFISSGKSEMIVVDVENSSNPTIKSIYEALDNDEGVWGVDLKGDKVYLLYITAVIPFTSTYAGIRCVEWEEI